MSEHSKTNTRSIAHSRLKKQIQVKNRKKHVAKFGIGAGCVFVVLIATLCIRNVLEENSHIRLKVFVDSSGVTGVLNVPHYSPILFLGDSVSAVRNVSKELPFYEKSIDTIFLLGTKESNITFFKFARTALTVAAVVRGSFVTETLGRALSDYSEKNSIATTGVVYKPGHVQIIPFFTGLPNTKSDTRRSNMAVLICVETCIMFSPNISDVVVRKIIKEKMITRKVDYVIPGSVRVGVKAGQKNSPRMELLQGFTRSFGDAALVSEVGEFEFEYSSPTLHKLSVQGNTNHAIEAGWHIKQKSPFEL